MDDGRIKQPQLSLSVEGCSCSITLNESQMYVNHQATLLIINKIILKLIITVWIL
jgi:hypothetical protein